MKRYGNLYNKITEFENLYLAYRKASLGHKENGEILEYMFDYESRLFQIQDELINKTYCTGEYKKFHVYDPKKRLIMSLPFRDRIVQHALCNVIEPIFDKGFIFDSYACRLNKGAHRGIQRVRKFINSLGDNIHVLKCDVAKYFYNIDHSQLKQIIRKKIKCEDTLWLIDHIIDSDGSDRGIPIGNLTSQLFANIYLNEIDYFVKQDLGIKYYVRYMDDIVILGNNKSELWDIFEQIKQYINNDLHIVFNGKTKLFPLSQGIDFLGYRQFYEFSLLRKRCIIKNKLNLLKLSKLYNSGKISFDKINQSIQSFIGHSKWANSWRIRNKILGNIILIGG